MLLVVFNVMDERLHFEISKLVEYEAKLGRLSFLIRDEVLVFEIYGVIGLIFSHFNQKQIINLVFEI